MVQKRDFAGKIALVTGAAQGMGKNIALGLAKDGAAVAVNDVDLKGAKRVASMIGGKALALQADVSSYSEVQKMVEKIAERFKRIDILVNNAGALKPTKFDRITEEEWDFVMDVNLKGAFVVSRLVVPIMKKNRYGKIVNLSSSAGKSISTLGGAHYTASKAGVLGLTRHMAKELARYGINVNAVCPGLIDTEMVRENCSPKRLRDYERSFPISRLGTPQEVTDLVLFLVSDRASYITGASIDINGGDLMI